MAYIPRSSFAQTDATPMQIQKKRTFHIVGFFGTLTLSCAILALAASYLYEGYLQSQLTSLKEQLNTLGQSDSDQKMIEIKTYDYKLNVAHTLLNNHIAVSSLFDKIGAATKQTIQFKNLEYTYDPGFEVELKLKGDTKELESVALQKMQFVKDSMFSDFVVRDISLSVPGKNEQTQTSQTKQSTAARTNIGTGFEVAGIFEKEMISYTGQHKIRSATEVISSPQTVSSGDSNFSTSPISNDENI